MKNTAIEWTDHTFNPWIGCTKISPGCAHCYAETRDIRLHQGKHWGKGAPRHRTSAANWSEPQKWNREARDAQAAHYPPSVPYVRPRVFCASLADWLDDEVPVQWLSDLLCLAIFKCTHLDWLLLTKRPQHWAERLIEVAKLDDIGGQIAQQWLAGKVPPNVWVGTTVEDQARADERIPELLSIPAKVRFLSCEPLLGPVHLRKAAKGIAHIEGNVKLDGIHWVICGGESGPQARPMHPDWARSLRDQCMAAGVPFLFKQWGEWYSIKYAGPNARITSIKIEGKEFHRWHDWNDGNFALPLGKKQTGRSLDDVEHNQFPEVK